MDRLPYIRTWLTASNGPAYGAALALIGVQVSIGIIMKSSQTEGHYAFSTSGCITISEFFKLLLSSRQLVFDRFDSGFGERWRRYGMVPNQWEEWWASPRRWLWKFGKFWETITSEVSLEARYGFAMLSLFYALINNTIFIAYKVADPGTISLVKSGVTIITALVTIATLGTKITGMQWAAIWLQTCGLFISQYQAKSGSSYPASTYAILLFHVFLSAIAGVYNQALMASDKLAAMHVQNMILYFSGVIVNLILHLPLRIFKNSEPEFFAGYTSLASFLVIIGNVFFGLTITAVYKYADAVIKCLATAVSTGILLYMAPILFGTQMSPLVMPGGMVVFVSSWLYMEAALPKEEQTFFQTSFRSKRTFISVLAEFVKKYSTLMLLLAASVAVLIVAELDIAWASVSDYHLNDPNVPIDEGIRTIQSPFENTMAFIRWNAYHPERIPLLQKYTPFFNTVHLSIPDYIRDPNLTHTYFNSTHDSYRDGTLIYVQVAKTMQRILDASPETQESNITGLLYFHFDAWTDPLAFVGEDFSKIWMPSVNGPMFRCMTDISKYDWRQFASDYNYQVASIQATTAISQANLDYKLDPNEFCVAWSDYWYIPRHVFADWILLSAFFATFDTFVEMAVPTMMHIIDASRRPSPDQSTLNLLADCYGGCCTPQTNVEDVLNSRCGHKLNYLGDQAVINATYDRLDREASLLGTRLDAEPWWVDRENKPENETIGRLTNSTRIAVEKAYAALGEDVVRSWSNRKGIQDLEPEEIAKLKGTMETIMGPFATMLKKVFGGGVGPGRKELETEHPGFITPRGLMAF